MEKRCINCKRLLLIDNNGIKTIKANNIEYTLNGIITVVCKCGKTNKF